MTLTLPFLSADKGALAHLDELFPASDEAFALLHAYGEELVS